MKDLTGQIFGKLIVIKRGENICDLTGRKKSRPAWICRCECGNELNIKQRSLLEHNKTCCGCSYDLSNKKKKDLRNQKFGKLTVVSEAELIVNKCGSKVAAWNCICDCGNTKIVTADYLLRKTNQSCGCNKQIIVGKGILQPNTRYNKLTTICYDGNGKWKSDYSPS